MPGTALERSSEFWDLLTNGHDPDTPTSLAEAVAAADLIAVGHVTGLRFGERVGGYGVSRATFTLAEILKGEPQTLNEGEITLQLLPADDRDRVRSLMPPERHLLFLTYVPWALERLGQPEEEQQRELYDYTVIEAMQGPLRDIDGTARVSHSENPAYFPAMLDGQPFDKVVTRVRKKIEPDD